VILSGLSGYFPVHGIRRLVKPEQLPLFYYNESMHSKIKRLEELVVNATAIIARLEEENAVLKKQVELLSAERGKSAKNSAAVRELAEFKAGIKKKLVRICARIEKACDPQPGLFEDEPDV